MQGFFMLFTLATERNEMAILTIQEKNYIRVLKDVTVPREKGQTTQDAWREIHNPRPTVFDVDSETIASEQISKIIEKSTCARTTH